MQLLISNPAEGVSLITSVDPYDHLEVYRIERDHWQATPQKPGIYLLYGVSDKGLVNIYIGMSRSNIRKRINNHHVSGKKDWFGTLYAIPVEDSILCPAIEADLIKQAQEADMVDVITNKANEELSRDSKNVHVAPAVEKIQEVLEMIIGSKIFSFAPEEETFDSLTGLQEQASQQEILDFIRDSHVKDDNVKQLINSLTEQVANYPGCRFSVYSTPQRPGGIFFYSPKAQLVEVPVQRHNLSKRGDDNFTLGYFALRWLSLFWRASSRFDGDEEWFRSRLSGDDAVTAKTYKGTPELRLHIITPKDLDVFLQALSGQAEQELDCE